MNFIDKVFGKNTLTKKRRRLVVSWLLILVGFNIIWDKIVDFAFRMLHNDSLLSYYGPVVKFSELVTLVVLIVLGVKIHKWKQESQDIA